MRIAYLSDLHLECEPAAGGALSPVLIAALAPAAGADLVALAGDIASGTDGIVLADAISDLVEAPVVYVAGNHEAYGGDLPRLQKQLHDAAWATDGRVWFQEADVTRFWFAGRPVVVLGCTLWTDYALNGDPQAAMDAASTRMNDHRSIGWGGGPFTPEHALTLHKRQRVWLAAQMAALIREKPRPAVLIVTHHAPCREGIGPRVADLAASYASDLTAEIARWGPLVWIHGHTHHRHETMLGEARILSAPRGYGPLAGSADYRCGVVEL